MLSLPVLAAPVARSLVRASSPSEGADQSTMLGIIFGLPSEGADQAGHVMLPPSEGVDQSLFGIWWDPSEGVDQSLVGFGVPSEGVDPSLV